MDTFNTNFTHILLADDDEDDVYIFHEVLKKLDVPVIFSIARNGYEVMEFLKTGTPDMIFLDLNMPIQNGQECLHSIRSDKRLDLLPVLMYSTSTHPAYINQCYDEGANFYIIKPSTYDAIAEILKKVLSADLDYLKRVTRDDFVIEGT